MSLPKILDFRQRVEAIPNIDKRMAFKTVSLVCGRIGEVITEKCPSDKTCNPTGSKLTVSKTTYQPDLNNPQERDTWTFIKLLQGQPVNYAEIAQITEEVAVFQVATEKRGGLIREIGLPLDEQYDPWVKQVYTYLTSKNENGFQYTRQSMWKTAKEAFEGMTYRIHPYKRAIIENGEYQYDKNEKLVKIQIPEKTKPFTDHGIRHLRNLQLKKRYGLTPEERAGYGGWTLATTVGTSTAQDAYEESPWRMWFPKMLKAV
jgi:hypothetical protein